MIPGLLGLAGTAGTGSALAPALQVLTYPFLILTVATLGRGWYLTLSHRTVTAWQRRSRMMLVGSTGLSIALWGLRFGGLLGERPF